MSGVSHAISVAMTGPTVSVVGEYSTEAPMSLHGVSTATESAVKEIVTGPSTWRSGSPTAMLVTTYDASMSTSGSPPALPPQALIAKAAATPTSTARMSPA